MSGTCNRWYSIVKNYNTLALTKAENRLAALNGIAQRMRDFLGSEYVAGLWKTSMVRDLCWKVGDSRHDKVSHPAASVLRTVMVLGLRDGYHILCHPSKTGSGGDETRAC